MTLRAALQTLPHDRIRSAVSEATDEHVQAWICHTAEQVWDVFPATRDVVRSELLEATALSQW